MARADSSRIERDLTQLLRIPSITGEEDAVQDAVADLLADAGVIVERLDVPIDDVADLEGFPGREIDRSSLPIVVAVVHGRQPGPRLMLQGHVDVVPPGDLDSWDSDPFQPVVDDGVVIARGACDMKGGLVAALEALRLLEQESFVGEVVLVAVPSEEDGGAGAFAAIRHGLTADACVITEPTGLDIVVAHGGAITFTLDVPGKAAHASVRREGVSAFDNLAYLVEALRTDEARRNEAEQDPRMRSLGLPYPTIIGRVEGGSWPSTVMDSVTAHGRYGVTLGQDSGGAEADLMRAVEVASAEHDFLADHPPTVTVWGGRFDSAAIPADHSLPMGLQSAAIAAGARRVPDLIAAPYGADMRLYINQGATPTVMYGPGSVEEAHAANERVAIADVTECANVLAAWVRAQHG